MNRNQKKDEVFMNAAVALSELATCDRKHVGALLVKEGRIISTGYNGSPSGMPHCDDVGHMMENGHCVRTIHAEANAITQAGVKKAKGSVLYTTASPCWPCFQLIAQARISRIVFKEIYRDERIFQFAKECGIELLLLRTCCAWHRSNPGPFDKDTKPVWRPRNPEQCRCLKDECDPCSIERIGCGCDGAMDDGCFNCTPDKHPRPACESLTENSK